MEEDDLKDSNESLAIIESMIARAKGNVKAGQFYFIMWGWAVAAINLFIYLAQTLFTYEKAQFAWMICFPLGIYTAIKSSKDSRKKRVKTHLDDLFNYMWIGYFVMVIIIIGAGAKVNFQLNPLIVLITGFPTFVTGLAIKFKPLVYGGIAFWIIAAISFILPYDVQNLMGALAVIVGYLVPGYLLKRQNESI